MTAAFPDFGRYQALGVLGEGGFATVFRGWHAQLRREVALKALLPWLARDAEVCRRFEAEAQLLASLRHPNIVTVYDVGESAGVPFFAMELVSGQTLAKLKTQQLLTIEWVLHILRSLASALDYIHGVGLVHRDLKPSNVMLDAAGRAVLMDFGIARALDGTQLTRTGASLGTPEYMSPEQVMGEPAGPAADVYALGILAYDLLAGRPPFQGQTPHVLHAQVYEPPPPLQQLRPDLPLPVYGIIATVLAKNPAQRPASAGRFVAELAHAFRATHAGQSPTVIAPDGFTPVPASQPSVRPQVSAAIAPTLVPRPTPPPVVHYPVQATNKGHVAGAALPRPQKQSAGSALPVALMAVGIALVVVWGLFLIYLLVGRLQFGTVRSWVIPRNVISELTVRKRLYWFESRKLISTLEDLHILACWLVAALTPCLLAIGMLGRRRSCLLVGAGLILVAMPPVALDFGAKVLPLDSYSGYTRLPFWVYVGYLVAVVMVGFVLAVLGAVLKQGTPPRPYRPQP